MSASLRGPAAEAVFVAWCLEQGYAVSLPAFGQQLPYDVVVGSPDVLRRVQVKRAHRRTGKRTDLRVDLTNRNGDEYAPEDVDAFAIVDVDAGRIWYLSAWEVEECKSLGLESGKHDEWLVKV